MIFKSLILRWSLKHNGKYSKCEAVVSKAKQMSMRLGSKGKDEAFKENIFNGDTVCWW